MVRKFAASALEDLKGKLMSAWISYYGISEEAQLEQDAFISRLEYDQVKVEKVKAFTLAENHIYLDALLEGIRFSHWVKKWGKAKLG